MWLVIFRIVLHDVSQNVDYVDCFFTYLENTGFYSQNFFLIGALLIMVDLILFIRCAYLRKGYSLFRVGHFEDCFVQLSCEFVKNNKCVKLCNNEVFADVDC